ncbi:DUF2470 domain-containing protein [Streptomyces sp. RFCAC02]|uniref:DUF2470 domain-containing protein n=1 Tax=Streptomyces sp. RFCAC02 TaxID=2499143 RepID=UPI001F0CF939|nr:DUF2470 domain-containing protein [Streptomyces sp. RFCAC02]
MESNASAVLTIPGAVPGPLGDLGHGVPEARAVGPAGTLFLLVPADAPAVKAAQHARADELTAVMDITDVAPVAVPHRVRARGWVAGWLTAVRDGDEHREAARILAERHPGSPLPGDAWALLRLEVGEAYTDDLWGEAQVEPDEFAAALPDPVARHEADLLQHLAASHGEQVWSLCSLLGDEQGGACPAWDAITPLSLDRFGLRVRLRSVGTVCDARFDFPEPVTDITGLRRAMHHLFEAAGAAS